MVNETFTTKYRPLLLNQFNIKELEDSLNTFINSEKISILLTGNSGTGKTTILQALAREYYGKNILLTDNNILSISTLKEQGISYYRNEVRVFCQSSSTIPGKKKMLILDDLDIINEQGQQVFTNCIDKYIHNVCFIASCSNIQKVIGCIQSRMDIIKVRSHSFSEMTVIANNIIVKECISLDPDVIVFAVNVSNGSVRILINYLEKFKLINKHIDSELASQLCTNMSFKELDRYTHNCIANNYSIAVGILISFVNKGYSVTDILDSYFTYLKHTEIIDEDIKYKIIPIICKYITIFHNIHEDEIELYFFTNNVISTLLNNKPI
jgi:DNA polymerase III delta prime subunit